MARDPEALYLQLGQLVAEMPDFHAPITPEVHRWLGRAAVLVAQASPSGADVVFLTTASDNLLGALQTRNAHQIATIVYRALAHAEEAAPAAARGTFVAAGAAFDAIKAIGEILSSALADVLVVDPYMDGKVLTDFAPLVPERVPVRLLTDPFSTKREALLPSLARWQQQFRDVRPLEARFTAPRALHDRLISCDRQVVWTLTQSLKDFAGRSPALVQRVDPDLAAMKSSFYEDAWSLASPI